MKRIVFAMLAIGAATLVLALTTACGGGGRTSESSEEKSAQLVAIDMIDNSFQPDNITIAPGDTVVWSNQESTVHTTTSGTPGSPDNRWDSGDLHEGETFRHVFEEPGTYPYYCNQHFSTGMTGMVTVREKIEGM